VSIEVVPGANAGFDLLVAPRRVPSRDGTAPGHGALVEILRAATAVPDHGHLRPWRFVVVSGSGRPSFSDALVAGLREQEGGEVPASVVSKMAGKPDAAPMQVMVVASPVVASKIPRWEQTVSASCAGYAIVLAATALGFGAAWKSARVLATAPVRALFAASPEEQLLGWINLGTCEQAAMRRASGPADLLDGRVTFVGPRPA